MSTIDELKKVYADITRASAKWQRQMIKDLHVKNLRADVRRTKRGAVMIAIEAVRKYRASSKRLSSDKREFLGMVEHYVDGVHNAIFKQPRNCWYLCATDGSRKVNLRCTGAWIANFQDNSIAWQEESHHAECYLVRNQTQLLELVQKLRTSDVWVIVKHPPSQFVVFAQIFINSTNFTEKCEYVSTAVPGRDSTHVLRVQWISRECARWTAFGAALARYAQV